VSYRIVEDYPRREHLEFYRRSASPTYGVTFELDATRLKGFLEQRGLPAYLNFSYFFLRALQAVEDFRIRLVGGNVVLYRQLLPALAVPAPRGLFSFCALPYDDDLETFNRLAAQPLAEASAGVQLTGGAEPNYVLFTSLPRVPFTAFHHVPPDDPTDGRPRVAFGKFRAADGRLHVPVALLVNHLYIDGGALGNLVDEAQRRFNEPETT
jgi:chloramphenicol O-acetyltransferase type A